MNERPGAQVLALLPNWLGDVAMCTPALRALSRMGTLTVAGTPSACDLIEGLPWCSQRIPFSARPGALKLLSTAWRLRPHARDVTVVFPHSFRAALLARLAGSNRRIGQARNGRSSLLTETIAPHRENGRIVPVYMAREYLELAVAAGGEDDGQGLELAADAELVRQIGRHFTDKGPRVGIAPGAAFGPSKRWPAERYGQVADILAKDANAQCMLLTGPGEEATRLAVLAAAKEPLFAFEAGHRSVHALKAAISQLDLLIGNDSGPRHVAVAFHVPVVCIMGPTSPRYSEGPYERGRVLRIDVDCGPCQKPECETDHRCMTQITTDQVAQAALEQIRSVGSDRSDWSACLL